MGRIGELKLEGIGVAALSADRREHWILKHINLTCKPGDRVGLLGRNGSGKTTLARILSNLSKPTEGSFSKKPKKSRVMLVLQRPEDLFSNDTVAKQIGGYFDKKPEMKEIIAVMESTGLSANLADFPLSKLSGGQQRLVGIVCAMATQADYIILDEPFAGLDSYGRDQVRKALINISNSRDFGMVIISHHPDDLLGLVEDLWILVEGQLLFSGKFRDVPISALDRCFSPNDGSFYYAMRQLESRNIMLPNEIYISTEPQRLAAILTEVLTK